MGTMAADQPRAGSRPIYVLAQISIHDRARYDRYAARFLDVLEAHQGVLLAADDKPAVIEGRWQRDKVVLVCFPDRDRFDSWISSPDYQRISTERTASTEGTVLLVRGLPGGTLDGTQEGPNDDLLRSR